MDQQEYVRRLLAGLSLVHCDTVAPEYEYPYWSFPNQEPTLQSHHNSLAPNSWGFLNSVPFFQYRLPPVSNGFGSLNLNSNRSVPLSDRRPRWRFSLESLKGRLVGLAKNQYGCKLLQKILGNGAPEEIEAVVLELIDHVGDLMVDQFGNYVVQKIVEVCSEEQRSQIVVALTETWFQLVTICLSMHGTRAVQLLLKYIHTPKEISMVMSALRPGFVVLTKDVNGHHVIIHCLKHFSFEDNKYLLNEVAKHCYDIARDKSGCCVLQLCVDNSQGETRDRLVAQIIAKALCLAEDPYGNYVIQHLLGSKIPEIISDVLKHLRGEYAALSRDKYGSNVVEKCLSMSTEEQSSQIIIELLCSPTASMILVDQYGNFVIQSALMVAKGEVYEALVGLIQMNLPMMRNNMYGKKVLAWFDRRRLPLV